MRPFVFLRQSVPTASIKSIIGLVIILNFSWIVFAAEKETATSKALTLVILGDSLTEGYGVASRASFPSKLQEIIDQQKGKNWKVINAGLSGSTSASAMSRVRWQLKNKPDLLILALGANDGLRGLSTDKMRENLAKAIEALQKEKVQVVLAGMQMPPNYNKDYTKKFAEVYVLLARKYKIKLIPFLLADVAGVINLNQADGIHPNEKGHEIIAQTVFKNIKDLL